MKITKPYLINKPYIYMETKYKDEDKVEVREFSSALKANA